MKPIKTVHYFISYDVRVVLDFAGLGTLLAAEGEAEECARKRLL